MSRILPSPSPLPATPSSPVPTSADNKLRTEHILIQLTTLRHTHQNNIAGYETVVESLKQRVDLLVKEKTALSERVRELEIAEAEMEGRMHLMAAGRKEVERERDELGKGKDEVEGEMVLMEAKGREMERELSLMEGRGREMGSELARLRVENEALKTQIGAREERPDSGNSEGGKLKRTGSVWKRLSRV